MEKQTGNVVPWGTLWRVAAFAALAFAVVKAAAVAGALAIAAVVALGLDPMVGWLERRGVGRGLGTFFAFVGGCASLALLAWFVIPATAAEIGAFAAFAAKSAGAFAQANFPDISPAAIAAHAQEWASFAGSAGAAFGGAVSFTVSKVLLGVLALMAAFHLSVDKNALENAIAAVAPEAARGRALRVFRGFKEKIGRWFFAQLLLCAIMGAVVSLGLWLIGVPYPLALGALAAVLDIVPLAGPMVAGTVAFLVAFPVSPALAAYAAIFFIFAQQLESNVLAPLVMGRMVRVHPLLVLAAIALGAAAAGIFGALLAVPAAVLVSEIFEAARETGGEWKADRNAS